MIGRSFALASLSIAVTLALANPTAARAQTSAPKGSNSALDAFSSDVERMVQRVSPSVVQILVTRYGGPERGGRNNVMAGWEQSIGSGVIVTTDGYIITNAHVVEKANQIRVRLVPRGSQTISAVLAQSFATPVSATLIGSFADADLALIKIQEHDLSPLPIAELGLSLIHI